MKSNFNNADCSQPCQVCGETNSTGWHCGSVTCEACKKFFLRNTKSNECFNNGCVLGTNNCVITKSSRANCPSCRFKKCHEVGMKITEKSSNQFVSFKDISCAVCGGASSGLHFGVITCEGCKGFFRRRIKEGTNLMCTSDGNCNITYNNRNACKACRFNACLKAGMDLNNCKIGRQSNLFKQQLKSSIKQNDSQETINLFSNIDSSQMNFIVSISPINSNNQFCSIDSLDKAEINMEDSLDVFTADLIKRIHNAYQQFLLPVNVSFCDGTQDYNIVLELIKTHTSNCVNFISNISYTKKFSIEDQKKILLNAIHPIRLIQIIDQNKYLNYFNADENKFQKIVNYFPIFNQVNDYLKVLADTIRPLKLDAKELALFTAFVIFSTSCRGLVNLKEFFNTNMELCRALMRYMQVRRNESETSDILINLSFKMEHLNLILQKGIYENCQCLKFTTGVQFDQFYDTILFSQFIE